MYLELFLISVVIISSTDICMLSDNIYDYYNVSQGKITIPSMDDGEECQLTDVSLSKFEGVPCISDVWEFERQTLYVVYPLWYEILVSNKTIYMDDNGYTNHSFEDIFFKCSWEWI